MIIRESFVITKCVVIFRFYADIFIEVKVKEVLEKTREMQV